MVQFPKIRYIGREIGLKKSSINLDMLHVGHPGGNVKHAGRNMAWNTVELETWCSVVHYEN